MIDLSLPMNRPRGGTANPHPRGMIGLVGVLLMCAASSAAQSAVVGESSRELLTRLQEDGTQLQAVAQDLKWCGKRDMRKKG